MGELFDRVDAAKLLRIGVITLDRYRKAGKISYIKMGGRILFSQKDIEEFLASLRIEAERR